jgi:hypothetical protein
MIDLEEMIHVEFGYQIDDNLPFTPIQPVTRNDLFKLMGKVGGFKVGAEIGVWNGVHAVEILGAIKGLELFCVDSWCGFSQEKFFTDQEMISVYEDAKANLSGRNVHIVKNTSVEASKLISDGALDFVYIDACHYFNEVMLDILLWAPKVRKGGIVAGHDFRDLYKCGVVDAIKAYTQANRIIEWYITFEEYPSWFWVAK